VLDALVDLDLQLLHGIVLIDGNISLKVAVLENDLEENGALVLYLQDVLQFVVELHLLESHRLELRELAENGQRLQVNVCELLTLVDPRHALVRDPLLARVIRRV